MKKILLFLCLLLVSCGKNEKLNVYSFILDKKLVKIERKGEIRIKETKDNFIGIIFDIEVYNEWLVNLDMVQSKVQFINIRDGSIERSFGRKGMGPGEMVDPSGFTISEDGKIFIYDNGVRKILCFNIDGEFLYSFAFPSDLSAGDNLKVRDGKLYISLLELRYANPSEIWKSRTIGVFDLKGNLLNLCGMHDEIKKTFTYGAEIWFDFDRFSNLYSIDRGTYRIYKYDKNYKLIKVFGVQGKFRLPKEDIPWNLPPQEIVKRLMRSSGTRSMIVSGDYVYHQFYDATEKAVREKNPLYSRYYLKLYDLDGNYIPSDIELPGILLDVDDEGRLYIYESDEPGNRVIGIYELKVVDKG